MACKPTALTERMEKGNDGREERGVFGLKGWEEDIGRKVFYFWTSMFATGLLKAQQIDMMMGSLAGLRSCFLGLD